MNDAQKLDTICSLLTWGTARLQQAAIEHPRREARLLLAHALEMTQEGLLREQNRAVSASRYEAFVARRARREPLAHVTGRREFWSLDLLVSPVTLIPRPESESLIEAAVAAFPDRSQVGAILDLGTGTGCLLLAALTEFPDAFGIGVDRSENALGLAARNASRLGLAARSGWICADWESAIAGQFDLVLCNPPYIPTSELAGLMPEVAGYEPRLALDGGDAGLAAYTRVVPAIPRLLRARGKAILELGPGQAEPVARMAQRAGLEPACRPDLAGVSRAMLLVGQNPAKALGSGGVGG